MAFVGGHSGFGDTNARSSEQKTLAMAVLQRCDPLRIIVTHIALEPTANGQPKDSVWAFACLGDMSAGGGVSLPAYMTALPSVPSGTSHYLCCSACFNVGLPADMADLALVSAGAIPCRYLTGGGVGLPAHMAAMP